MNWGTAFQVLPFREDSAPFTELISGAAHVSSCIFLYEKKKKCCELATHRYNSCMNPVAFNTQTELYCIFGNPVRHSLSPVMHNAAFQSTARNAVYLAFQPDTIEHAIDAMRTLNIRGASITIPFKIEVLKYLDRVDTLAREIGSVNTLVNDDGTIAGFNTDGYGALISLKNVIESLAGLRVMLLGNGGSARAIAFTLLEEDIAVTIAGRNVERVTALANDLRKKNDRVTSLLMDELTPDIMQDFDILINTTPVGMTPHTDTTPLDDALILPRHTVFDIVYAPSMTKLMGIARQKGCTTVFGIDMLLNQGAKQYEIWTGTRAPTAEMRTALMKHLT